MWSQMKAKSEIKFNLFNVLNRNFDLLIKGEYMAIEKEVFLLIFKVFHLVDMFFFNV